MESKRGSKCLLLESHEILPPKRPARGIGIGRMPPLITIASRLVDNAQYMTHQSKLLLTNPQGVSRRDEFASSTYFL